MLPSLAASLGKLLHMPLFGHKMWFSAAPATALVTMGWYRCMLSHLNYWVHALLKVSISCSTLPYMVMRRGSKNSFLSGGAGRRVDLLAGPPIALILGECHYYQLLTSWLATTSVLIFSLFLLSYSYSLCLFSLRPCSYQITPFLELTSPAS